MSDFIVLIELIEREWEGRKQCMKKVQEINLARVEMALKKVYQEDF